MMDADNVFIDQNSLTGGGWVEDGDGARIYVMRERGQNGYAVFAEGGEFLGYTDFRYETYEEVLANVVSVGQLPVPATGFSPVVWIYVVAAVVFSVAAFVFSAALFAGGKKKGVVTGKRDKSNDPPDEE